MPNTFERLEKAVKNFKLHKHGEHFGCSICTNRSADIVAAFADFKREWEGRQELTPEMVEAVKLDFDFIIRTADWKKMAAVFNITCPRFVENVNRLLVSFIPAQPVAPKTVRERAIEILDDPDNPFGYTGNARKLYMILADELDAIRKEMRRDQ